MQPEVMLVEDEALVMMMIEDALEGQGFLTVPARSGEEAVAVLEAGDRRPCVLVTDVNLGPGLKGWDVARRARVKNPRMGVIYITGDSAAAWAAQGVPMSILVEKPFAPAQVVTAVSTLLSRNSAAQPAG